MTQMDPGRRWAGRALMSLAACIATLTLLPADARSRPNVVVFLTDDQPHSALGAMGNAHVKTPHLDRLAAEGVLFENAFVTTSICSVSRASLLTGQHMARHGIDDFQRPLSAEQWAATFPVLLRAAGYRTAYLGKLGIGSPGSAPRELSLPADRFDLWYGFPQLIRYKHRGRYLTTILEEKAIAFLSKHREGAPFLLVMALKEPHGKFDYADPDLPPGLVKLPIPEPKTMTAAAFARLPAAIRESLNTRSFDADYQTRMARFYRYVARADIAVGRIVRALQELGLDDDTVILFMSDNGILQGEHGLRGKWNMYEESIRVPLIIRDPRLPEGARGRRRQMALNIDVAPTVLGLAGLPVPAAMQGVDLGPILRDPKAAGREDWYYEHDTVLRVEGKPLPSCEGVRTHRWKYIRYKDTDPLQEELFDLARDPFEERDLSRDAAQAETLARLRARTDAYRRTLR
jgi:arylsulfatase A-like enzyme